MGKLTHTFGCYHCRRRWEVFGIVTGGFWALVALMVLLRGWLLRHGHYRTWRLTRALLLAAMVAFVVSAWTA